MRRFAGPAITALCIAIAALVVLLVLAPAVLGLQRYVITGGSMTGTIDKGSLVYSRLTPVGRLKVGDIVTFVPPGYASPCHAPHHQHHPGAGRAGRVFRTKGDFNTVADPWRLSPSISPGRRAASTTSRTWATCWRPSPCVPCGCC